MGRLGKRLAGFTVLALVGSGLSGIASLPAGAAGCTETLTTETSYTGTSGDDVVCIAGTGDYTVDTGDGNDVVKVTAAATSVDATLGDGNDAYTGTRATTSIVDAGTGNDKVTTGNGDDTVDGGPGTDLIVTRAGDDTVTRDFLIGHAEVVAAVLDEHIPFFEAAFVEQHLDAFARRKLTFGVLRCDALLATTESRVSALLLELLNDVVHGLIPYSGKFLSIRFEKVE